jgi:hypothetical protein
MIIPPKDLETLTFLTWFFRSSEFWHSGRQLVCDLGIDPEKCVVSVLAGADISENPTGAVCALFLTDGRRLIFDFSCDHKTGECQKITRVAENWVILAPIENMADWLAHSPQFTEFDQAVRARVPSEE